MRVLSTGVKLERDKKGGAKKGMWTRLSSRVGVKNVKTDSITIQVQKEDLLENIRLWMRILRRRRKLSWMQRQMS